MGGAWDAWGTQGHTWDVGTLSHTQGTWGHSGRSWDTLGGMCVGCGNTHWRHAGHVRAARGGLMGTRRMQGHTLETGRAHVGTCVG